MGGQKQEWTNCKNEVLRNRDFKFLQIWKCLFLEDVTYYI